MKKKWLFFVMVCMIVLCSACTREDFDSLIRGGGLTYDSPDNTKINIVVSGVDGGVMSGSYACEWNGQYAYYDSGVIYYFESEGAEAKTVEHSKPVQMAMNDEYLYLTASNGIYAVDLNTMEKCFIGDKDYTVMGINVYSDGVFVRLDERHLGDVYDISELKLNCVSEDYSQFREDTKRYVGWYGYYAQSFYYVFNGKTFFITTSYFYTDSGKQDYIGEIKVSEELTAEYNGRVYVLYQASRVHHTGSVTYDRKVCDHLVCVDPETEIAESIYQTPGPQEQIVNYSVENNEMYLLVEGILYKTDLKGEQRVELANYVGAGVLYFDYANDTLFVYDGDKLLGQYK